MEHAKTNILKSFPKVFWVANVMELFERAAYYGMNSVLAVYLTNSVAERGLGFSEQSVGFLQSIIYALVYVVPIIGGALADRYGYRRMLMVAFSLLSAGYFLTGNMSTYGTVFASLLILATGAGLFKPIISGTIARTTTEVNSGFGFGIFYWMINLGAFLAPLVVSYLKGFSWSYVFLASSLYCAMMLLPSLFVYRDPARTANTKSLKEVLGGAAMVLGDSRFMLMIVLYSGFWILYFQNFGSVLWFLRDFVEKAPVDAFFASMGIPLKFDAEYVTVINAGTIILLQVIVSRVVQKTKPLPTMIAGMIIGTAGFVCLAFADTAWIFIIGIVVFSIGEMTAHPKYLSYVGLVAPTDKKAVYMGYASLYGVVGSLIGSNLGGTLYESMLKPLVGQSGIEGDIRTFWLIFAALGLVAVSGLLLYNRFFAENTLKTNALARRVMFSIYLCLLLLGIWFFANSISGDEVQYKTMVQSGILILLGGGGLFMTVRQKFIRPGETAS
jgi:POT family proton-dependent oligopeptide transporter